MASKVRKRFNAELRLSALASRHDWFGTWDRRKGAQNTEARKNKYKYSEQFLKDKILVNGGS